MVDWASGTRLRLIELCSQSNDGVSYPILTLFYRIFKSKYFSTGTFLSAKLGSNPSFVWRSFLSARDLLLDGVCWKIGNGLLVDVWSDKWTERPLIQGRDPSGVHCVADLMDAGGWDMEVID
jgi:hypothetical protein